VRENDNPCKNCPDYGYYCHICPDALLTDAEQHELDDMIDHFMRDRGKIKEKGGN